MKDTKSNCCYYSEFYQLTKSKKDKSQKWQRIFNRMRQDDFNIVVSRDGICYWIQMQTYAKTISQELERELKKFMKTKGILSLD